MGKKILFVSLTASSIVSFRLHLITYFLREGHNVSAAAPDFTSSSKHILESLGCVCIDSRLSRLSLNPWTILREIFDLYLILRKNNPDIVVCYFLKSVIFGNVAATLSGIKRRILLIEGLGYFFSGPESLGLIARINRLIILLLYRVTTLFASRIMTLNEDDKQFFLSSRMCGVGKIVQVGAIGVDLNKWKKLPPVSAPISFIFIGRLIEQKGVREFVGAARLVKLKFPDVTFYLLGEIDGSLGSINHHELLGWVNEKLVVYPGHVDIRPWLARSSCFVLPSYYREGVPLSSQEALASGRAILTTNGPGCRETIVDGLNGFVVEPRNQLDLYEKMIRLIEHPVLIERFGDASRKLAEAKFNIDVNSKKMASEILGL
jgi:glycosyltransferase involved in cell wall biosynthesis